MFCFFIVKIFEVIFVLVLVLRFVLLKSVDFYRVCVGSVGVVSIGVLLFVFIVGMVVVVVILCIVFFFCVMLELFIVDMYGYGDIFVDSVGF